MPWPNGAEMATVERYYHVSLQALRERDDGGVGSTKWKICVLLDEFSDSLPVFGQRRFHVEMAECAKERGLSTCPETSSNEVRHLCNDQGWNNQPEV